MKEEILKDSHWIISLILLMGSVILWTIMSINFNLSYIQMLLISLFTIYPATLWHLESSKKLR